MRIQTNAMPCEITAIPSRHSADDVRAALLGAGLAAERKRQEEIKAVYSSYCEAFGCQVVNEVGENVAVAAIRDGMSAEDFDAALEATR